MTSCRTRNRSVSAGLAVLTVLLAVHLHAQQPRSAPAAPQQLHFVAGTPDSDFEYPATLYRSEGGKLKLIREIVSQNEGVESVQVCGDTIFLVHPAQVPRSVAIVHMDKPTVPDNVLINQESTFFVGLSLSAQSEPRSGIVGDLLASFWGPADPGNLVLIEVLSKPNGSSERVQLNRWEAYQALRKEGETGGPGYFNDFTAGVAENQLIFPPAYGHRIIIDTIPTFLRDAIRRNTAPSVSIIAASQRYVLVKLNYTAQEWSSGKADRAADIFIHDRIRNTWTTIQIEGNRSRSRLFGSWLATMVGEFNQDNVKISPGRENERSSGGAGQFGRLSAPRPNVRSLYLSQAPTIWIPGILVLQNLENDQRIRIETGQEDSEILWIGNDSVLYRVNDAIYQARIAGNQLQGASLIVKDEDVPEIHWVFWGP